MPFPPLARTPPPPRSRFDPRQANVARVVGALLDAVGGSAGARPANLATGFRASAVDVGRVKAIVEAGIAAFDMHQVKTRWKRDVRAWMVGTLRAWVQLQAHPLAAARSGDPGRAADAGRRGLLRLRLRRVPSTSSSEAAGAQTDAGTAPDRSLERNGEEKAIELTAPRAPSYKESP